MKLDLDRQAPGRSDLDLTGTLKLELGHGRPVEVAVRGVLAVQNLEARVLVSGKMEATGQAECGRCLALFELTWSVPVDLMVLRDVDSDEEEGETLLILQKAGEVDLSEPLRECAVLAFPQAPVCRPDCLGLCPECGVDRNREQCDCEQESHDPRWDALP